jgi:hypothetical protein
VAGGTGAVLTFILLLLLVILASRPARAGRRVLGAVLGLLADVALSVLLQQLLWLDPRSLVTLLPPATGLLAGAALPGVLRPPETGRVGS